MASSGVESTKCGTHHLPGGGARRSAGSELARQDDVAGEDHQLQDDRARGCGLARARITAFVDSNPRYQGKQVSGIPILSPAELAGRSEAILVSSLISQDEIVRQIRHDLRLGNEIITLSPTGLAP